jgi:predicted transcriptional regulator
MKTKTSITLSPEAARALDRLAARHGSRSGVIERAIRELAAREEKKAQDAKELELINRNADRLNKEAEDVLGFQVDT